MSRCVNLIKTYPHRFSAVIAVKRESTKYCLKGDDYFYSHLFIYFFDKLTLLCRNLFFTLPFKRFFVNLLFCKNLYISMYKSNKRGKHPRGWITTSLQGMPFYLKKKKCE